MSISVSRRGCILKVLDQSGSTESFADRIADSGNGTLANLLLSVPADSTGKPKDILDVGVLGFGGFGVESAFSGPLAGRDLVTLPELEQNPLRTAPPSDPTADLPEMPIWVEPKASGGTPFVEMLQYVDEICERFIQQNPDSDMPLVIIASDGEPTTGNPLAAARSLVQKALVFNFHFSSQAASPVVFPASDSQLPPPAQLLYEMSSELPDALRVRAAQYQLCGSDNPPEPGARAMVFGASVSDLFKLIEFGSQAATLNR